MSHSGDDKLENHRALWAKFKRSLETGGSNPRSDKIPVQLTGEDSKAGTLQQRKYWFKVWVEAGCSWEAVFPPAKKQRIASAGAVAEETGAAGAVAEETGAASSASGSRVDSTVASDNSAP